MKKTLICNVKMSVPPRASTYSGGDKSLPASDSKVCYPVTAFLEETLKSGDELHVIMLAKMDSTGQYEQNVALCAKELGGAAAMNGAAFSSETVYSPFEENEQTHGDLMLSIIEKVPEGTTLLVDMTYGPKDLAIVEFSALHFLEDFCNCEIDNILYGHTTFVDGVPTDGKLCDMAALYYISSIMNKVKTDDSERAVKMLKVVLGRM